jgi:hypothetical protein
MVTTMKKGDDVLVVTSKRAGKFSAEETTRLALIAAYSKAPFANKSVDKVLRSLDGAAKKLGAEVLALNRPTGGQKASAKVFVVKGAKKTASKAAKKFSVGAGGNKQSAAKNLVVARKAAKNVSHQQDVERLAKWGQSVG